MSFTNGNNLVLQLNYRYWGNWGSSTGRARCIKRGILRTLNSVGPIGMERAHPQCQWSNLSVLNLNWTQCSTLASFHRSLSRNPFHFKNKGMNWESFWSNKRRRPQMGKGLLGEGGRWIEPGSASIWGLWCPPLSVWESYMKPAEGSTSMSCCYFTYGELEQSPTQWPAYEAWRMRTIPEGCQRNSAGEGVWKCVFTIRSSCRGTWVSSETISELTDRMTAVWQQ